MAAPGAKTLGAQGERTESQERNGRRFWNKPCRQSGARIVKGIAEQGHLWSAGSIRRRIGQAQIDPAVAQWAAHLSAVLKRKEHILVIEAVRRSAILIEQA